MPTTVNGQLLGNGINLQPSYYNNGNPNFAWKFMRQQSKIQTLRIEIEPDKHTQAIAWIAQAKGHGYQVIATYHNKDVVTENNDVADLINAARWWAAHYQLLGGNFAINLMNEWSSHNITANAYAEAYNQAIAIVRTVYNGDIIIDLPGWAQDTHIAYDAFNPADPLITDAHVILSVHLYQNSWNRITGNFLTKADLNKLAATGKRCIVGEFGTGPLSGQCNWQQCVSHAHLKGWTVIGWCWNGDGHGLNMVSPSWNDNHTAQQFVKSSYFDTIYNNL